MRMNILNEVSAIHKILIQGPSDKDVQLSVQAPDWLDVEIKSLEKSVLKRWNLEFSLNKPLLAVTQDDILVKTNLPRFEKLYIRIVVEPKPILRVSPPILFMSTDEPGTKKFEIVFLKDASQKENKQTSTNIEKYLIRIEPSSDCIKIKSLHSGNSNAQRYVVVVQGCTRSPQNLRIIAHDQVIHKVPIIIPKVQD